jgi:hypothetical protein
MRAYQGSLMASHRSHRTLASDSNPGSMAYRQRLWVSNRQHPWVSTRQVADIDLSYVHVTNANIFPGAEAQASHYLESSPLGVLAVYLPYKL